MSSNCILCGKCLEVCPLLLATNREELSPRAKSDLGRLLESGEFDLDDVDISKLTNMCLGCHRCKQVCSQGVDVPGLVSSLRGEHPTFKQWLWKNWLTHGKLLWKTGSQAASVIPESLHPDKFGPHLKMLAGLQGDSGLVPFVEPVRFSTRYRGEGMLLFAGCTANYVQGRWLVTALRLLDGLGVDVMPGDFQCCGTGLKGVGYKEESQSMARNNVQVWRDAGKPKVVTFCATCQSGLMGYDDFSTDEERDEWEKSLTSLSYLVCDTECVIDDKPSKTIGYHRPCHARGEDADLQFLRKTLADRLMVVSDKDCCGFGGVMRLSEPDVAGQVNQKCWSRFDAVEVVLTGCSACAVQLTSTVPEGRLAGHWLEIMK